MTETETTPLPRTGTGLFLPAGTILTETGTARPPIGTGTVALTGTGTTPATGTETKIGNTGTGRTRTETKIYRTGTNLTGTETTPAAETRTNPTRTETNPTGTGTDPGKVLRWHVIHPVPRSRSGQTTETGTETTGTETTGTDRQPKHATEPATPGTFRRFRTWLGDGGSLGALSIVVAVVASLGQKIFAESKNFTELIKVSSYDITPWLAVGVFDLAVASLLHGGIRAARKTAAHPENKGASPWPWWTGAAIVGGLSIYTNTQHTGAWVTAPASAVLLTIWFLRLFGEYLELTADRRAAAPPKLIWSTLSLIDFDLARRAWVISSTRAMRQGVAYRASLNETIDARDLAIRCARLYRDIYRDQLRVMLYLDPVDGPVRLWQRDRRQYAEQVAVMTATDAVDGYLGQPVIEREGIKTGRVTYAPLADTAGHLAPPQAAPVVTVPASRPAPTVAERVAAAAPMQVPAPAPIPLPAAPAVPENAPVSPAPRGLDIDTILASIVGLPAVPADYMCGCRYKNGAPCGWTLREHVARKAPQVRVVLAYLDENVSDWSTRIERVGTGLVKTVCEAAELPASKNIQNQVAWLFDDFRKIAAANA